MAQAQVVSAGRTHYVPTDQVHFTWDVDHEPVLTVASGDTVVVHTRDVSDNQITPESTADAIAALDWDRVYPLAGPIVVEGRCPGTRSRSRSSTCTRRVGGGRRSCPASGSCPEDFPDPYLKIFDLTGGEFTHLRDDIAIPIAPFLGTMGVCPAGASQQAVMPPGVFGGNMDTRQLVRGTTLYLPVQVEGALFSCGDAHAAQGDGEVCVTGIESPMYGVLRFTLHEDRSIPAPQYQTAPGPLTPQVGRRRVLRHHRRRARPVRGRAGSGSRHDRLPGHTYDLPPEDAYVLSSLRVDLKISEIVDAGEYVVSAVLPLSVFRNAAVRGAR